MGAITPVSKFITCLNLLMGAAGALALIDADLGRYARSSADIGIAAYIGSFCLDILMVVIGGIILFAGMPALIDYYVNVVGLIPEQAGQVAFESTDRIAAAFIIFGGVLGFFLMVAAQVKAQVLNTYSSSLSLANLFDAVFAWRPGRLFFVVLANLLSLLFLYGEILKWFYEFLVSLGILTTCFGSIMLSDYFLVRPMLDHNQIDRYGMDNVNWAGVLSIFLAYGLAHFVLNSIIPVEFMTSLAVSFLVYPVLRIVVFRPKYHAPAQASAEAQSR
jgi:cytosine permease